MQKHLILHIFPSRTYIRECFSYTYYSLLVFCKQDVRRSLLHICNDLLLRGLVIILFQAQRNWHYISIVSFPFSTTVNILLVYDVEHSVTTCRHRMFSMRFDVKEENKVMLKY